MNLYDIRQECWNMALEVGTSDVDRFWPEAQMDTYTNRIYRMIARETRCIKDASTPAVCLIASTPVDYTTYATNTLDYLWANDPDSWLYQKDVAPYLHDLHESIIDVDSVQWVSRRTRLTKVSYTKWEERVDWEQHIGVPTEFALNLQGGKLAVNYRDEKSDTLRLYVRRMPLKVLEDPSDEPEFPVNYHDAFFNGVLWLMYSKQDSETFDLNKAKEYMGLFKQDMDEIKQSENLMHERLRPNHSMEGHR